MPKSYLVQEEDGVSRFTLEDDGGFLLLEEWVGVATVEGDDRPAVTVEGSIIAVTVTGSDRAAATVELTP